MSRVITTPHLRVLLAHAIPWWSASYSLGSLPFWPSQLDSALLTLIPSPSSLDGAEIQQDSRPLFRKNQEKVRGKRHPQDNFCGIKEIKAFTQEEQESCAPAGPGRADRRHVRALKVTSASSGD